uniref:ATP synthase complex subunit 8 n=1 Tax=Liachirus melanospilos TaxID=367195 RepID=W6D6P8_9PLEU|nr:ATP synthase F0 subunit 8 [Liachirus melanospilos]AHI96043.1 ATP synthase subunit 8 [Liachirus melanospilos]
MPQLSTSPWMPIFCLTWLIFLTQIPPKVMSHRHLTKPSPVLATKATKTPWNWPWY